MQKEKIIFTFVQEPDTDEASPDDVQDVLAADEDAEARSVTESQVKIYDALFNAS